ncbi:MAG: CHAT domain-containing protein [Saprospirales bacterium]|nr:CHAT domain-containing protein [Saprospirales bacterium]
MIPHIRSNISIKTFTDSVKELKPHIIHFIGHGAEAETDSGEPVGRLVFHSDDFREEEGVDSEELRKRFARILADKCPLKLVFLNACLTGLQARAISAAGLTVIGSNSNINSVNARRFATGFYKKYSENEDVNAAVHDGFDYVVDAVDYVQVFENGQEIDLKR